MKTQISSLVKGDHREGIVGTSSEYRREIALQVRKENPKEIVIKIRGIKLTLQAHWSTSRKSVYYQTQIPVELYVEFLGDFALPQKEAKAFLTIQNDCTVTIQTNSKKDCFNYVKESEITILDNSYYVGKKESEYSPL